MKGRILDWNKVKFATVAGSRVIDPNYVPMVIGAVQHFINDQIESYQIAGAGKALADRELIRVGAQHFATTGDFPTSVLEKMMKVHATDLVDGAWMDCFHPVDIRQTQRNGIDVTNVEGNVAFGIVAEGDKAKVFKMGGTKTSVFCDQYGGGMGWSRRLIEDAEYWTIEDNTIQFLNKWASSKEQIHYDLIEYLRTNVTVATTAWQAVTPANVPDSNENYTAIRDMNTISKMALDLVTNNKDKGYGIAPQTTFVLVAPLALRNRILRALGVLNANISGLFAGVQYNIVPRFTTRFSSQSYYFMTVMGGGSRNLHVNRQDLRVESKTEIESNSEYMYGWARYGSAILDSQLWAIGATA